MLIHDLIAQHLEEAAFLWSIRDRIARLGDFTLFDLTRHDERLAAHIDGVRVARDDGWVVEDPAAEPGVFFVDALLRLESRDGAGIEARLEQAEADPALESAFASALRWCSARHLQGTVKAMLDSDRGFRRRLGIDCCVAHGVDPGAALAAALEADGPLRASAYRAAGRLGRTDLLERCREHADAADEESGDWAAWSAALLGRDERAAARLVRCRPPERREAMLTLAMKVLAPGPANEHMRTLAENPAATRELFVCIAAHGRPQHIPWLIERMADPDVCRPAAMAFQCITGVDLIERAMDRPKPEPAADEAAEDDDVDVAADEGLPWPDQDAIKCWWDDHRDRFPADGRYFMGAPPGAALCAETLRRGYQYQRAAAAEYLSLIRSGTPVFDIGNPAWRQQRILEKWK